MSRCRSTSFYLAPGHLVYFKDYTLATWDPTTKEIVQFTHRGDLAAFSKANPSWDGVCVVSNLDFYSLEAAVWSGNFTNFSANWGEAGDEDWDDWDGHEPAGQGDDLIVELWRLDARTIEGRRPQDSPEFSVHRWAHGGAAAAGGVRSIVDACFPSAKKNLARAATDAVTAGETLRVYVVSEALAAGLITPAEAAALLASQASGPPLPVLPRPATRRLLEHVLKDLEQPERLALLHELSDPWRFVNDADRLALAASPASPAGVLEFLSQDAPEDLRSVLIVNPALPRATALRLMLEEVAKERPARALIAAYGTRNDVTFEAATQELKEVMRAQLDSTGPFRMRGVTNWAVLSDLATAFAGHPQITAEQAGELVTECGLPRQAFALLLKARPDLPESAIRSVLAQGLSTLDINRVPEVVKAAALSHPNCPKGLLVSAARLPRWSASVVKHPALSLDEALDIYESGGPGVEAALAQRHDIEPEMLSVLATSYQRDTVAAVAGNPLTPPEALAQLARRDIVPLAVVLANPSCPEGVVKHHLRKPESLLEIFAPANAHPGAAGPSDYCAEFAAVSVEDFAAGLRALEKDLKESHALTTAELERIRHVYRVLCQAPFHEEDIARLFLALSDVPSTAAILASNPSLDASSRRRVFSTLTMRQRQTLIDSLLTRWAPEEDLLCAVAASDGDPVVVSKAIAFGLPWRSAFRSVTPTAAQRILDLVAADTNRPSELRGLSQAALAEHPTLAGYVRALASKHFARPVGPDAAQAPASLGEYLLHDKQGKPLADQVPAQEPLALRFTQPLSNALLSGKPISKGTRSLTELPNARDGAFPLTAEQSDLADVLNGRKVPGGVIRVLDSRAALSKNANFMGNCTASYGAAIAEGSTLMLAIDNEAGKTVWNVSLNKSSYAGTWSIGEINTRFNRGSGGARPIVDALAELGIHTGSRYYDDGDYYVDDYDEGAVDPVHLEHPDDYYVPDERLDEPSYADGLAYPDEDNQISFGDWYSEHAAENWTASPPEFSVAKLLQAKPLSGPGSGQWWEEVDTGSTPSPIDRWEDWEEANLGARLAKELLRTRVGAAPQPSRKR